MTNEYTDKEIELSKRSMHIVYDLIKDDPKEMSQWIDDTAELLVEYRRTIKLLKDYNETFVK